MIDDLHWLDPSSVGLVEIVVDAQRTDPLSSLPATRPGRVPAWAASDDVTRIRLDGLAEPDTARLATLVARAAVDADGARNIHQRTGGNPLFVGETVRAFLEDGTLQLRDGRVALTGRGGSRLPVTLRAVLGARIDALPPPAREVLGAASVVGSVSARRSWRSSWMARSKHTRSTILPTARSSPPAMTTTGGSLMR